MIKQWYEKFSAQPHQPFFANGIIFFILFMSLLFASYSNLLTLKTSILAFHAYALIFIVFSQFFLGFLFVVFPRFLMQANVLPSKYMKIFGLYFSGSILFFIGVIVSPILYIVGILLVFMAQILSFDVIFKIYKKSVTTDKAARYDTKWILVSFATGLISHGIFIVSLIDFPNAYDVERFAIYSGFYLYLFIIIFAVSQRMIPFFTSIKVQGYKINKSSYLMEKVYGLLLLKLFVVTLQAPQLYIIADLPLFILFTYELFKWRLPLFKVTAIMWVLFIGLYWIPVGFLLSGLESIAYIFNIDWLFEKASLHTFAVGYFITVLIGFGTRVVLGHSGKTPHADKIATAIFIFIQLVVFVRLFASFSLNFRFDYIFWVNHSALLLILGLIIWSIKFLHILIKGHKPSH